MAKIEFEEYKVKLTDLEPKLSALGDSLGLDAARESLERLHAMAESDGFWNDTENSQKVTKQIRQLYARINKLGIMDRALVLLWLENLSYEEIGAIAGISAKNVSVKLVRIKQQLMKMSDNQEC